MNKSEVVSLKKVFIDVHRKTKTKDIPSEPYYIAYNSMCGFHVVKVRNKEILELLYDTDKLKCGNNYLEFSKYGADWEVNYVLGTLDSVDKKFLLEKYKIA